MYSNAGASTSAQKDKTDPMQHTSRNRLARQLLFPYSGENALTFKQALRVFLAWALAIPLVLTCCTMLFAALLATSMQSFVASALFTFLSGAGIFGGLGILVIVTNNASARVRRKKQAVEASNTSGVKDGSQR